MIDAYHDLPQPKTGFRPHLFRARKPCPGMYMRRDKSGAAVISLHYSADPTMDLAKLEKLRAKSTSQAIWDMEMEGNATAMEGQLVYPEFDVKIHVLPHDTVMWEDKERGIRRKFCRYMSIDPHPRTPHAMLWVGIDKWEDWWIYREMWESPNYGEYRNLTDSDVTKQFSSREYAEAIAFLEWNTLEFRNEHTANEYASYRPQAGGERILQRFMDQAGKGFNEQGTNDVYAKRYRQYGITCSDPKKEHKIGEDAIRDLLRPRHHELLGLWPRLHVSDRCVEIILEFQEYRYAQTQPWRVDVKELNQRGVEARCHQLDNMRYLATSGARYSARDAS